MLRVMRRLWLPLLVLLMVVIGGFVITRMHGIFGSDTEITREGFGINNDAKPFNPKQVTYEVFGPAGSVATINYLDLSANPQSVKGAPLPWLLTLSTTAPATMPILLAQGNAVKTIARELGLRESTVRNHVRLLLQALGAHSQLEAVARARAFGLVS